MKLHSKRRKPNLERNYVAYATKRSEHGSKLEPFMKLFRKRSETESGMQPRSFETCIKRDRNDPISFRLLPGFIPEIVRFDSHL